METRIHCLLLEEQIKHFRDRLNNETSQRAKDYLEGLIDGLKNARDLIYEDFKNGK